MNEYNQSPEDDARDKSTPEGTPPPPPQPGDTPPVAPQPAAGHSASEIQSKKLASGLLAILVGGLGIHKFYLGYQQEGIVMILVTLLGGGVGTMLTCGLLAPVLAVMPIIGLVEGIIYLTKTDEEFAETYLRNKRPWF